MLNPLVTLEEAKAHPPARHTSGGWRVEPHPTEPGKALVTFRTFVNDGDGPPEEDWVVARHKEPPPDGWILER